MTSPDLPTVTVVIPHHNGPHLLRDSLGSLRGLDYPGDRWDCVVVDDASTDDSVAVLERDFPGVRIFRNDRNLGFAASCNRGARESNAEWIAFLNNDTRVDARWLRGLVEAVSVPEGVVAAGSKILDWEGSRVTFQGGWLNWTGHGFEDACPRGCGDEITAPKDLFFASGCAMLVHREMFLSTGGFDEQFFGFYEDTDFGWRIRLYGYRTRLAPDSIVYHRGHASFDAQGRTRRLALIERNSLWQILRNLGDEALERIIPAALLLTAKRHQLLEGEGRRPDSLASRMGAAYRTLATGSSSRSSTGDFVPALSDVFDGIGAVLRQRGEIQSRRTVPDSRILTPEFFPTPHRVWFLDGEMEQALERGGYARTAREIAARFGVTDIFPLPPP